jgi:hypothetical protein
MRLTTTALGAVAAISLIWCQPTGAAPISGSGLNQAAIAASTAQQVQYYERHTGHRVIKCYRELIVGPYICHAYHRWWW